MLSLHVLISLIAVESIHVMINPGDEQCFWDQASEGQVVSHWYEPLKEIDEDALNAKIFGPNDQIVIELTNTEGERLVYNALEEGIYTWCYENAGSSRILVHFKNMVGLSKVSKASVGANKHVWNIEDEIQQLTVNSDSVYDSLNIYRQRLEQHTLQADKALRAQTYFSLLKLVVFAGSALSVVYWMKTLFETKRRI